MCEEWKIDAEVIEIDLRVCKARIEILDFDT